jgi:CdiI immunity protein
MKQDGNSTTPKKLFSPDNFPALSDFLPAYLNQDFGAEYGSAADAVKAFLADASGDEIQNLREEWPVFRKTFLGRPLSEIQHALVKLGAAWHPQSEQELAAVDEILSQAEA